MQLLIKYRFRLIEIAVLFSVFILTIQLREKQLQSPLSMEYEWITAHTLMTLEIWDENGGPQAYGFNPIYAYPGKGNRGISGLGGVSDEEGYHYYVSYPPFAFIFAYYSTKLLGGTDVYSLRSLSLILQFISAFLIYLIVRSWYTKEFKSISMAAIIGGCLYLLSTGYLWAHSVLYFSDILIQPLVLWMILLFSKILQSEEEPNSFIIASLSVCVFLSVYTEWLGLLLAFFTGLAYLYFYLRKKRKILLKAFAATALAASLSLSLTVIQYSSISGFKAFKEVSLNKYEERSGHSTVSSAQSWNFENPESFKLLRSNLDRNFLMAENLLGITVLLLIPFLIWRKSRSKMKLNQVKLSVLIVVILSVLVHYLLFYNFNALHNFSNLKTGLVMILTIAIFIHLIESSVNWKLQTLIGVILLYFVIDRSLTDFRRFERIFETQPFNTDRFESAMAVRQHSGQDLYVFHNIHPSPAYYYIAGQLTFPIQNIADAKAVLEMYGSSQGQYYHHQGHKLIYMLPIHIKKDNLVTGDTLYFN